MKILITGSTGLLGQALTRHLARRAEVTGLSRSAPSQPAAARHIAANLCDARRIAEILGALAPDVIVHAQALSDVDRCEQEPALAHEQNVRTIEHVVNALTGRPTLVVYVSTDYVFDGTKGAAYVEADAPQPVSVYGRSKLDGEQAALRHPRSLVVRTSTLFGPGRMNFCDHVIASLTQSRRVEAFTDQMTSPTYTEDLAEAIGAVCETLHRREAVGASRIVHIANRGGCTRLALAERIADLLGASRALIQPIRIADQHRPAPRPRCSMLASSVLPALLGRTLRSWDEALQAYLRETRRLNNVPRPAGQAAGSGGNCS